MDGLIGNVIPKREVTTEQIKDNAVTADKLGVLTTKGDNLNFDTKHVRVPIGSNDKVLTADSTEDAGVAWKAAQGGNPLTTKGDLFGYSTLAARLPVGTAGQILSVDATEATGLKWIEPPAGGSASCGPLQIDPYIYNSITQGTLTWTQSDSDYLNGNMNNDSADADGDEWDYAIETSAGDWTLVVCMRKAANAGILETYISDDLVDTEDGYSAATTYNNKIVTTSITLLAEITTLAFKINSKHASSSAYAAFIESITMWRTS